MAELDCFSCHKKITYVERLSIREECPHCGADAHVCRNCAHYDSKVYNECREPQSDRVQVKDRLNRCDYFLPKLAGAEKAVSQAQSLREAAEALFKKK